MSEIKNYIFLNKFWDGFKERTDAEHIGFFELIFSKTKLYPFEFTNDMNKANILFESFGDTFYDKKVWNKKIFFSGESWITHDDRYNIVLKSSYDYSNIINLPLFVVYIHTNTTFLHRLIHRPLKTYDTIPKKFCCFCVSNSSSQPRNKMFQIVNSYKKVDSFGKFNNNIGFYAPGKYWSEEYINFLSQYKFIICFENSKYDTYITEKIVNAYLANSVPIYWGSSTVNTFFKQFIYLENENNDTDYYDVLNKIKELDQNDELYLDFINQSVFSENAFNQQFSIDIISNKINNLL
jgi:hypothetical protein